MSKSFNFSKLLELVVDFPSTEPTGNIKHTGREPGGDVLLLICDKLIHLVAEATYSWDANNPGGKHGEAGINSAQ